MARPTMSMPTSASASHGGIGVIGRAASNRRVVRNNRASSSSATAAALPHHGALPLAAVGIGHQQHQQQQQSAWAWAPCPQQQQHHQHQHQQPRPQRRRGPAPAAALPAAVEALAESPLRDAACAFAAAAGAYAWVKIWNGVAKRGWMDRTLTRKLVHATSGPLFVLTWPLFSAAPEARVVAAVVPALNLIRLALVGSGVVDDPGLVKSTSRSGDRSELLRGPLLYVAVLAGATLVFWRDSAAGLVAISLICGGDGLADIVGRRLGGTNRLPWNQAKSWVGSAAMFAGGAAMSYGFIALFSYLGYLPYAHDDAGALVPALLGICAAGTVVESLPITAWVDDNLSVPMVAAALALLLL